MIHPLVVEKGEANDIFRRVGQKCGIGKARNLHASLKKRPTPQEGQFALPQMQELPIFAVVQRTYLKRAPMLLPYRSKR